MPELLQAGLFVGLTLFGLAALNPWLALAALPAVPIQLLGLRHYLSHVVPLYSHQRVQEGERTQRLIGAITGAKTSRALGLGALRRDEVETTSLAAVDTALRAARLQSDRFGRAMNGGELVGLASVLVTGFLLVRAGQRHGRRGDRRGAVLPPRVRPRRDAVRARRRLPGGGVRAHAPDGRDDARRRAARSTRPATRARSRSPRSTTPTSTSTRCCTGSTCEIAPGERVALIGTTGAGKTTIARIAAGLEPPTQGTVEVGGEVGLVTQEVHVFAGTLAADLRLAKPDADRRGAQRRARPGRRELGPRAARDPASARAATRSRRRRRSRSRSPASRCTTRRSRSSTRPAPKPAARARARWRPRRSACSTAAPRWSSPTGSRRPAHADRIVVLEHGRDRRTGHARAIAREQGQIRATLGGLARLDSPQWSGES